MRRNELDACIGEHDQSETPMSRKARDMGHPATVISRDEEDDIVLVHKDRVAMSLILGALNALGCLISYAPLPRSSFPFGWFWMLGFAPVILLVTLIFAAKDAFKASLRPQAGLAVALSIPVAVCLSRINLG